MTRKTFLNSLGAMGVYSAFSAVANQDLPAGNVTSNSVPTDATTPNEATAHLPYENADGSATDAVFLRRVYLEITGQLPTKEKAKDFASSTNPNKRSKLIERLLDSDDFADYWSMRFCDILRVKSEFPINLWPNAVYVFHRRIHAFVQRDEAWNDFAKRLLLATGSNFRDPEVNFLRATAKRTPQGYAEISALTFLGKTWEQLTPTEQQKFSSWFNCVRIKDTREWKEEILLTEGEDTRIKFVKYLNGTGKKDFASAFVQRIDAWLLGLSQPLPEHIEWFEKSGYHLKPLLRKIFNSPLYAHGSITGGFVCHRLDAEVLDDAICDLTGSDRAYQSIAPEPFTFLPKNRRSVLIEDGSISNAFLLLFGRPARDSGQLSERHQEITAKQRLYLFNSGKLYNQLGRIVDKKPFRKMKREDMITDLYWQFYSRAPTSEELQYLLNYFKNLPRTGGERWRFPRDLAWCLVNSREFLYQH